MSHWIIAPIVLPLLAGATLLLTRARRAERLLATIATLALIYVATRLISQSIGEPEIYRLGDWPAPYGITLVLDRLSALLLLLTAVLGLGALLYAIAANEDERGHNFHALFQFQLLGINGAFLTGDLFNLFVFFEILLIASYCLLMHGHGPARSRATVHLVALNLVGSAVFLIAIAIIYSVTGTLNLVDLAVKVPLVAPDSAAVLEAGALLLLIVFALKAALLPLYFWLPSAYTSACASVAALFAVMTKVGAYSILRVYTLVFGDDAGELSDVAGPWLLPAALATIVTGMLGAMASRDLRGLVAYLVIISVGTLLASIGLFSQRGYAAATYYLVQSTLATGALFLLADLIRRQRGEAGDSFDDSQVVTEPVLLGSLFFVGAVAVIGLPPLSGFVGKLAILQAAAPDAWVVWVVVLTSSFATLVTVSRGASALFWRTGPAHETGVRAGFGPTVIVAWLLASSVLLVVFGAPLLEWADAVAAQLEDHQAYVSAVLGSVSSAGGEP